jgi:hypothetical protein
VYPPGTKRSVEKKKKKYAKNSGIIGAKSTDANTEDARERFKKTQKRAK